MTRPDKEWQHLRGIYKKVVEEKRQQAIENWYNKDARPVQKRYFKSVVKGIFGAKQLTPVTDADPHYSAAKVSVEVYGYGIIREEYKTAAIWWLCNTPADKEKFLNICSSLSSTFKKYASAYSEQFPTHKNNLMGSKRHVTPTDTLSLLPLGNIGRLEREGKLPPPPVSVTHRMDDTNNQSKRPQRLLRAAVKQVEARGGGGEEGNSNNPLGPSYDISGFRNPKYQSHKPWAVMDLPASNQSEFREAFGKRQFAVDKTTPRNSSTIHSNRRHPDLEHTATVGTCSPSFRLNKAGLKKDTAAAKKERQLQTFVPNHTNIYDANLRYITTYSQSFLAAEEAETEHSKKLKTRLEAKSFKKQHTMGRAVPWDCQAEGFTTDALQSTYARDIDHTSGLMHSTTENRPKTVPTQSLSSPATNL